MKAIWPTCSKFVMNVEWLNGVWTTGVNGGGGEVVRKNICGVSAQGATLLEALYASCHYTLHTLYFDR